MQPHEVEDEPGPLLPGLVHAMLGPADIARREGQVRVDLETQPLFGRTPIAAPSDHMLHGPGKGESPDNAIQRALRHAGILLVRRAHGISFLPSLAGH